MYFEGLEEYLPPDPVIETLRTTTEKRAVAAAYLQVRVLYTNQAAEITGDTEKQLDAWRESGEGPPWIEFEDGRIGYRLIRLLEHVVAREKATMDSPKQPRKSRKAA